MNEHVAVDPSRTAVLAVDVQRVFTDPELPLSPPLTDVLPNITRFLECARRAGAPVFLVRLVIPPDQDSHNMRIWPASFREQIRPGAAGTDWDPCVGPCDGDIEIIKQRYSSFFGTDLDAMLRKKDIDTVVVCGLTTNVCVQSTVRDSWQLNYRTITLSDCCSESGENSHAAALYWIARNFGEVRASDDIIWQRGGA